MFGSITKLFSGLFGLLGSILTLPLKLFSSGKGKDAKPKKKSSGAFFLEADDATGVKAENNTKAKTQEAKAQKAKPETAPVAATANALNLPQPTVTTSATPAAPVSNYAQFGPARRPGANMKSYLDMAKTMKGA